MQIDFDESSSTSQHHIASNFSEITGKEKTNNPPAIYRHDPLRGCRKNIDEGNSDLELEESVDVMSQVSSNSGLQDYTKMNDLELR